MAKRICFVSTPFQYPIYGEKEIEFEYFNGFSISQKQKSIKSLHKNIHRMDESLKILEISTKSNDAIGVALSAFNLSFYDLNSRKTFSIENVFQSSKVFEKGGPYRDLMNVHPKDAKRDERLKTSGKLTHFNYGGTIWSNEPKTMFYDWIYMSSLYRDKNLSKRILEYNAFTDIEFNQSKSINCQARSAAIFVSLSILGKIEEVLNSTEELKKIYLPENNDTFQISMF